MLIPVLFVRDLAEAIDFLTRILDFSCAGVAPDDAPMYAVLVRGDDELHLNLAFEGHGHGGATAIVICDDVDALFCAFTARGLRPARGKESPVHQGPLDQTWGTREVYVDDPSGNTLVFQQRR